MTLRPELAGLRLLAAPLNYRRTLPEEIMAQQNSFDVTTGADLQEVDNAIHQASKEIATRYDFKGSPVELKLDKTKNLIVLEAENDYKLKSAYDVLQTKFVKRGVPLKNLKPGKEQPAAGGRVRQELALTQGIPTDTAKEIVKRVKAAGYKKVQVAIQGDELRVSSPSKDELQQVIAFLKAEDFGIELKFGNYR
jgi:hypothetical protein